LASETGSALVIAMLVTVIMALLGISFLLMGETENLIALNEKRAAQSLYVAEAGARAVKRWFDDPEGALLFPPPAAIDRTQRAIVDEDDPYDLAAATPANGIVGSFPYYKQQVDLDGDTVDDLFRAPYRGGLEHALMGTEDGPDIRIDDSVPGPARDYLDQLSARLFGDFPPEGGDVTARISSIEIFAPPYVEVGSNWNRYGLATIKVVARIYQPEVDNGDPRARVLAEREVQAVLSEAPYYGPFGPLHSCGDLSFRRQGGPLGVHWGAMTAERGTRLTGAPGFSAAPLGLPRSAPAAPRLDLLWDVSDPLVVEDFAALHDGEPGAVWDPWFRSLSGEALDGAPEGGQPLAVPPPPPPGLPGCCDRSNLVQSFPLVSCPEYDYDVWKTMASSGEREQHYFVWDGSRFRENGVGPALTFEEATDEREGIYFFDTKDAVEPYDVDGDGFFDNLTPPITVQDAGWFFNGVLFLNAESFQLDVDPGATRAITLNAPGEPFQDTNQNGRHDPGEGVVHLTYPTTLGGVGAIRDPGGAELRAERGPDVASNASFHGILFTNGAFVATGSGRLYGSVVAKQGVTQLVDDGSLPTPELYFDESVVTGWPPPDWDLPRVTVTRWITDR
jgi:hypothetical protein